MSQDKDFEIAHNEAIREKAEFFWGWQTPAGRLRAERRASLIIHEIKARGFSRVLEVGSGTGVFAEFLQREGLEVHALDISWQTLKRMKREKPHLGNINSMAGDAERLPYSDNSFDASVGVCVLHHLDIVPVFKEIIRVLKPGGIIVFSEPNMMNPQLMIQKNIKLIKRLSILGETENETAFFKWQMKSTLRKIGFKNISVEPFDFLHPWTPKPLIPYVKVLGTILEKLPVIREIAGSLLIKATK